MTIVDLSVRLERVERENRRFRAGGIVALVCGAALAAMGQSAPPAGRIRAEGLEIVDGNGKLRAALLVLPDGSPGLMLFGPPGDDDSIGTDAP